jgi:hypothetical protein
MMRTSYVYDGHHNLTQVNDHSRLARKTLSRGRVPEEGLSNVLMISKKHKKMVRRNGRGGCRRWTGHPRTPVRFFGDFKGCMFSDVGVRGGARFVHRQSQRRGGHPA